MTLIEELEMYLNKINRSYGYPYCGDIALAIVKNKKEQEK